MKPDCDYYKDCDRVDGGCCMHPDLPGGTLPSHGVCNGCRYNRAKGRKLLPETVQVRTPTAEERAKAEAARIEQFHRIWREIHLGALAGKLTGDRLGEILKRMPCRACLDHFNAIRATDPLPIDPAEQFPWSVRVHSAVSQSIGKPAMGVAEAKQLYLDASVTG